MSGPVQRSSEQDRYSSRNDHPPYARKYYPPSGRGHQSSNEPKCIKVPIYGKYLSFIRDGSKTIEGRIYSGQFKNLRAGDEITFFFRQEEEVRCKVIQVIVYKSFEEMLAIKENIPKCLPDVKDYDKAVKTYHDIKGFQERASQSGVVAIHIERIRAQTLPPVVNATVPPIVRPTVRFATPVAALVPTAPLKRKAEDAELESVKRPNTEAPRSEANRSSAEAPRSEAKRSRDEDTGPETKLSRTDTLEVSQATQSIKKTLKEYQEQRQK